MFELNQMYQFSFPTDIRFGVGARKLLPGLLSNQKATRPLLITDNGLRNSPMVRALLDDVAHLKPAVFSDFSGNPLSIHVDQGVIAYKAHLADAIIAIGGGATLDIAKAIGLMTCHEGTIFDYIDGQATRNIEHNLPFFVALPTTSGTGSEVGRSTVISDPDTKIKKIIFHPKLLPHVVLADPQLVHDMPAFVTAATGMDALSHLLESFLAKGFHPVCDGIALWGLKGLKDNFETCYEVALAPHKDNALQLQARGMMMMAAMMGAIAFQKGLGVTHSLAHALGTVCDMHHGLANGVMLPYAMSFNRRAVPERFTDIERTLGLKDNELIVWIEALKARMQVPKHLSELNVKKEQLPDLVEVAVNDGCHHNNPKTVTREDFEQLFLSAL